MKSITRCVDPCDNLQVFIINHSISGGTGAGLTFLSHPTQVYNTVLLLGMHILR